MRLGVADRRSATSPVLATMRIAAAALSSFAVASLHAQVPASQPVASLVQLGIDAVAPLRAHGTLSAWRRDHPQENVFVPMSRAGDSPKDPDIGDFEQLWCGVAGDTGTMRRDVALRRRAYFYVPQRMAGATSPALGNRTANDCVLGAIEVTVPPASFAKADSAFGADSARLVARFGPLADTGMIGWFFDRTSSRERIWHAGDFTIGLAAIALDSAGRGDVRFTREVVISGPGFPDDMDFGRRYPRTAGVDAKPVHHAAELDTVLAWSGLDAATTSSLLRYADRFAQDTGYGHFGAVETGRLATLLERVVRPEPSVIAEQRSARLVTADMLLDAGARDIGFAGDADSTTRARFTAIGETFGEDDVEKSYYLTHGWLEQAVTLDSRGPAGDRAFLLALRRAFDFSAGCGAGSDRFRDVIKHGERYLTTRAQSSIRGEVELLVAEGYSDIVALASGADYDGIDAITNAADSAGARATAVRHFREGYRLAGTSSRAAADWANAWRLSAGLPPEATHFYCIND